MRTQQFFDHHGVASNPFAEEDAQTDRVFKSRCVEVRHPAWDKVFGDPADPATSLVFGEKGAGKTAMRLQIADAIEKHNHASTTGQGGESRLWVIEYDDFNPLLDRFADRLPARKQRDPSRVLAEWKLWDHMDCVLSLAVTDLVDHVLGAETPRGPTANVLHAGDARAKLDRSQKRDLLVLAACYDDSHTEPPVERWQRLRRALRFTSWAGWKWAAIGVLVTIVVAGLLYWSKDAAWLSGPWPYLAVAAGWLPWIYKWCDRQILAAAIRRRVRVIRRDATALRRQLMGLTHADLANQPMPVHRRTDDRYELFAKLQGVLRTLGSTGVVVLVDRIDEPHLTGGRVEHMRDFVWSMLDNKFLKQPGVGVKLLLPAELHEHLAREDRDFHQRARLDKQNVIPSLDWTGEALLDLANARLAACAAEGRTPQLRDLIDPAVSDARVLDALRSLRTPRHMFKFLFRMLTTHCTGHTDGDPSYRVSPETFEAVLAVYSREQASVDRGLGLA
ncbi:MAG: hypothetical protein AAFV43_16905 [Planctomycetota bacterium]